MPAIDKVQVTIIPAARIVDKVKGQVAGEKLFHLKLSLINGDDWFAISQQAFSKEEILQCASLFVGLNKFQAERVENVVYTVPGQQHSVFQVMHLKI